MTLRVAVLCSGNGSNLQALLDRIASGHVDAKVVLVASDKPDALALDRARKAKVPTILALPPEAGEKRLAYDERLLVAIRAEKPDLLVLAGYMRIAGKAITDAFAGRLVNIHPSLLPQFKGLDAVGQAHAAKVAQTGCTTHLVTQDLDGGPILLQAGLKLHPWESVDELRKRVLALEHLLLPRTVQLFAESRVMDGQVRPGKSTWMTAKDLDLVSGAWYAEGF